MKMPFGTYKYSWSLYYLVVVILMQMLIKFGDNFYACLCLIWVTHGPELVDEGFLYCYSLAYK